MGSFIFQSTFQEKPNALKPREKLHEYGTEGLLLWELVALILRTGERHKGGIFEDVEQLSRRLLSEGGFKGLFMQRSVPETMDMFGIYKSHAEVIVAISEICRRIHGSFDSFDVHTPERIGRKFHSLQNLKQEQCHVLLVQNNQCISSELIGMGGKDEVHINFSDVLRTAIWLGIKEIIIVHNHIGSKKPSTQDIQWTLALHKGAQELHNISVRDHVIIGNDGYFSFVESGLL